MLCNALRLGLQRGFLTNLWEMFSSILILIGILAVVHFHLGLTSLVIAFAGAPVLGTWMNAGYFFGISRRDLLPKWSMVSRRVIEKITRLRRPVLRSSVDGCDFLLRRQFHHCPHSWRCKCNCFFHPATHVRRHYYRCHHADDTPLAGLWRGHLSRRFALGPAHALRTMLGVFVFTTVVSAGLLLFSNKLLYWWVGPGIHPSFMLMLGLAVSGGIE